jgi:ABC-type transport system substrate-binding protein
MLSLNDNVALEAAFRSEQIHRWEVPSTVLKRLRNEIGDRMRVESTTSLAVNAWHLNMKQNHPWVKDQRIREAFYRVTEREQFISLVYDGEAVVQPGPIPAGLEAYQLDSKDTEKFYKVDVGAAKQLLDAAQWDYNHEYEVISSNTSPLTQTADAVWQNQLAKAGVKIRVSSLPFAEWLPNRIAKANYDMILNGSPADDTPARAMRLFHSDQKNQFGNFGLGDPTIDAMIEKSETTVDREENVKLVKQIQLEVLKKYAPTYQIVTQITNTMLNNKVQNFELNPATSPMYRTEMWMKS